MVTWSIRTGDCRALLDELPAESVHCVVTSPPYWGLRSYLPDDHPSKALELGSEETPDEYINRMVDVFQRVRRVLRPDGTCWVNLGDCYAGSAAGVAGKHFLPGSKINAARVQREKRGIGLKPKDLVGIPWRFAFALQADGWWLRSEIIWAKPSPLPEGVSDRPQKSHETIFLLTRSARYWYDADASREPHQDRAGPPSRFGNYSGRTSGRKEDPNGQARKRMVFRDKCAYDPRGRRRRDVWVVPPAPFRGAHFAAFPPALIEPCVLSGCPIGGTVLDPFCGVGTAGIVALLHGRNFIGLELYEQYAAMGEDRIRAEVPLLAAGGTKEVSVG